jgi:hypothetical protein
MDVELYLEAFRWRWWCFRFDVDKAGTDGDVRR